jgi:hypothetical protein
MSRRRPAPLLLSAVLLAACGEEAGSRASGDGKGPAKGPAATRTSWTAEEMTADPEGYLVWADQQLAAQIDLRRERLDSVAKRRGELVQRKAAFSTNYDDLLNVQKRLQTAVRKAEDEDRWPVKMGGRSFERAKAETILNEIGRHVDERSPLMKTYDDGLGKLDQIAATLKADTDRLTALRDRLAVDLEQVRVSHGVAELEKLRTTEAEIAHYAQILGSIAEDATSAVPNAPPPVDLDKLLE